MKYKKEFKQDHPETIGETDYTFDLANYAEWLEKKYEELKKQLSINGVMQATPEKVCDNCEGKGGRDFTDGFYPCPKCKGSGVTNL